MYEQEPTVAGMDTGPMRKMAEYINKALVSAQDSR
jgi:hypothetical protein